MVTENIFFTSTLHLFHRYKSAIIVFAAMTLIAVVAHHFLFPAYMATASLRVNPSAANFMSVGGKGVDFGGINTEPDYVRYLKLMRSVNFRNYVTAQLAKDPQFKSKIQQIYGDQSSADLDAYTDLIFNDFDYSGRENDIIDIVANNNSASDAVLLANLLASKARSYLLENEAVEADETIDYLNKQAQNQQDRINGYNKQVESSYSEGANRGPSSAEATVAALMQDLNSTRVKIRENGYLALEIIEQIKGAGSSPEAEQQLTSDENVRGRLVDKLRDLKEEDKAYKSKAKALEDQIKTLQAKIDPHQETKSASLQRKLGLEQDIYFTLKKKVFDYEVYKVALGSHVRMYSDAVMKNVNRKLSLGKKMTLALIFSLLLATLGVLLREKVNPTVCHSLHLKSLGIGFLTAIPDLTKTKSRKAEKSLSGNDLLIENFAIKNSRTLPFQFLRLKILQLFHNADRPSIVVTLMSCSTGQGKSVVAANMATCFNFYEMKTVLVDCDSNHSGMGQFFKPEHNVGFSDWIEGSANLSHIIHKTCIGNLDFISSGKDHFVAPGRFHKRVEEMTEELKKSYDLIIFNAPDFFESDNAIALSQTSDLVIAVSDAFHTRLSQLSHVVHTLRLNNVENIFGVINRAEDYFGMNNTSFETANELNQNVLHFPRGA